jgi:hypothetical protein
MWAIEEINRGELEILLPSYQSDPRPVYALYTEKDKLPLKVQVCINYLTEYFVDVAKIYQGMRPGIALARRQRRRCRRAGKRIQNQAVPPTVRLSTFSVGWPTPTGTLWPSLPQTPTPLSSFRSLPTIEICCMASIPEPIRVAPSPLS